MTLVSPLSYGQLAFASLSVLLILPSLHVILRTGSLHVNCKCILLFSFVAALLVIGVQFGVLLHEIVNDLPEPVYFLSDKTWYFWHNIGYGLSSLCMFWLVVDKLAATRNLLAYAVMTHPHPVACVAFALTTVPTSVLWSYCNYFTIEGFCYGNTLYGTILALVIDSSVFLMSMVAMFVSRAQNNKSIGRATLGERHQKSNTTEPFSLSQSSRRSSNWRLSFHPSLTNSASLLIPPVFLSLYTLNCVVLKVILVGVHRGLRRTFCRTFLCSKTSTPLSTRVEPAEDGRLYFSKLRDSWGVPQSAPRSSIDQETAFYD